MSQQQTFTYSYLDPAKGSSFYVDLPTAWEDANYHVQATLIGVSAIFGIDLPQNDRSTTQFRVITTADPQVGDLIEFNVFEVHGSLIVPAPAFHLEGAQSNANVTLSDGQWTFAANAVLSAPVALPVGATFIGVRYYYARGSATITLHAYERNSSNTRTELLSYTINTGSGWTNVALAVGYVMAADSEVYFQVSVAGANSSTIAGWLAVDYS